MSTVTDSALVDLLLSTYRDMSNSALARGWGVSNGYVSQLRAGRRAKLSPLTRAAALSLLRARGVEPGGDAIAREAALERLLDSGAEGRTAEYYEGVRDMARRVIGLVQAIADATPEVAPPTANAGVLGAPARVGRGDSPASSKRRGGV